jgi:transposase
VTPRKDVHNGDDGKEAAAAAKVIYPGVQGRGGRTGAQPGNTAGSVARDLNLTETAVRAWAKQADLDQGRRSDGLTSEQLSEMAQLRKELGEACEERDILKRAVAFFAREIR